MFTELIVVALSLSTIYFLEAITSPDPPILHSYRIFNPFYYVKFIFMFLVLHLRQFLAKRKGGKLIANKPFEELEGPQQLLNHKRAVDAVYFSGGNQNGDYLVVATSRRQNNLIDGFLYLKLKNSDYGILETLKLPGTDLRQKDDESGFTAEGIKIECLEAMRKWKISFQGRLKAHNQPEKHYDALLDLEYTSNLPYFDFDSDLHPISNAAAIASEKWSKNYFEILKAVHQTHYEQFGKISGQAVVDGKTFKLDVDVVRDHSFGLREWRNFHRYVLHYFTAENGDQFAVLIISMPICFSNLTVGYVVDGASKEISPVYWCDFELYQQGEDQPPPIDYGFSFKAGDKTYNVEVCVEHFPSFYISKDWEGKCYEGMATYKIDGKRAWGIAEWEYRNIEGRNALKENESPSLFN